LKYTQNGKIMTFNMENNDEVSVGHSKDDISIRQRFKRRGKNKQMICYSNGKSKWTAKDTKETTWKHWRMWKSWKMFVKN